MYTYIYIYIYTYVHITKGLSFEGNYITMTNIDTTKVAICRK